MLLSDKINEKVNLYVYNKLTLKEFREWFAPALRDAHNAGDPDGERLAHAVEWAFFDLKTKGEKSEDALKQKLSQLVADFAKYQQSHPALVVTSFLLRRELGLAENGQTVLMYENHLFPSVPEENPVQSVTVTGAFVGTP